MKDSSAADRPILRINRRHAPSAFQNRLKGVHERFTNLSLGLLAIVLVIRFDATE
jgi:hypothetical protein